MRNTGAFFVKEMRLYFEAPTAYVVMTAFLALAGFFFYDLMSSFAQTLNYYQYMAQNPAAMEQLNVNDLVVAPLFQNINVLLLLVVPLFTMRAFAEEKKLGTDELILTSPVAVHEVVLGKFFAALAFYGLLLLLTFHFPAILYKIGNPDTGRLLASYVGLLLMGATFIAVGIFASSLTSNQVVAAVISFAVLLLFWITGWLAEGVGEPFNKVLQYVSMTEHFEGFSEGLVKLPDVLFYVSAIVFALFLTVRAVESARWR
jgi:ABC-2 type transport system permease protein